MEPNQENAFPLGPWRKFDEQPPVDVAAMDWLLTDPWTGPNARCPYCYEDFADPENTYHDGVPIADSKCDDEFMPQDNCTYCRKPVDNHPERHMFSYEQIALNLRKRTMPPTQPSAQYYQTELPANIAPAVVRSFDYQTHPTLAMPEPCAHAKNRGLCRPRWRKWWQNDTLRQPTGAPQDPGAGSAKRKMGSGLYMQQGTGGNDDLTMLVVNAETNLKQVTLAQFVAAIFTDEIKMFHDYQPDAIERFKTCTQRAVVIRRVWQRHQGEQASSSA
jgi:hypothetical protein